MMNPTSVTVDTNTPTLLSKVRVRFISSVTPSSKFEQDYTVPPSPVFPLAINIAPFVATLPADAYNVAAIGIAPNGQAGPELNTTPQYASVGPVLTSAVLA